MKQEDFLAMIAEITELDSGSISMDSRLDALSWDSLCDISFIAGVDRMTGLEINADHLAQSKTVADLYRLVPVTA